MARLALILLAAWPLLGCTRRAGPAPSGATGPTAPLFEGMGPLHHAVETRSPEAQRYFDQGLTWVYAFNHDEAVRSFLAALELDPDLAMARWGVALALGPHINNTAVAPQRAERAYRSIREAQRGTAGLSDLHRALIDAQARRFQWPAPEDRQGLDRAYAAAMEEVYQRFPGEPDVATLYAEALMNLQPWVYWGPRGEPNGRTGEIRTVLEAVMARYPRHPGAPHLFIHLMEASPTPGAALGAAEVLRGLVPASSHLLHMPAHIDVRVGAWGRAAEASRRAIAADGAYRERSPEQDFYRIYMFHNDQFLAFIGMMSGRPEEALAAARAAVKAVPADWREDNAALVDGYMTIELDVLKRFGRWDELLAMAAPPRSLPFTTAMWRFNRAVALAAQGKVAEAERARRAFLDAVAGVPEGAVAQVNPAREVLSLAGDVLDGELAYARKDLGAAEAALRRAVAREDALVYMEPPDWMLPVRHTLGAVLTDAGQHQEAERVYREDLEKWPDNPWSLLGLEQALRGQGKSAEAAEAARRARQAWASDGPLPRASCLCAPE